VIGGGPSLKLVNLFGIRIGVNGSWFLVLFLFIFWLNDSFRNTMDTSESTAFIVAVIAALLFFGSIVLHEIGHAVAARRSGIDVSGIDLFFFGGVMKMSSDSQSPGQEFKIAAAGPLVTFGLVLFFTAVGVGVAGGWEGFWDTARLASDADASPLAVVVSFLVTMNALLLVFNLIPAFPLDGGRLARAAAWKLTGDRGKATRFAALIGQGFAYLLMGYGVYRALDGEPFNGIWLIVLGWLLGGAARGAVAQTAFSERLEGVTVADIMDAEPVTIPASLTAAQAHEEFFLRYQGWDWFAVVDDEGRYLGIAHRPAVEHAALQEGGAATMGDIVGSAADVARVRADAPLEQLLGSEPLRSLGALMAVDDTGRLRGVVTIEQVSRALQARLA
jgi:Zn-dependent protease